MSDAAWLCLVKQHGPFTVRWRSGHEEHPIGVQTFQRQHRRGSVTTVPHASRRCAAKPQLSVRTAAHQFPRQRGELLHEAAELHPHRVGQ